MAEGGHDGDRGEAEGYLINGTLPGPDICDICGSREVENVLKEFIIRLDTSRGDLEPQEINLHLSKLELCRVEGAATLATNLKELADVEEVLLNGVVVHNAVIHAGLLGAGEASHDVSLPVAVAIPSTEQALGQCAISISGPWAYKSSELLICWVDWNRMVSVPVINGGLNLAGWDGGHDGPGGHGVVGLPWCVLVEWRVVHNSSGTPIMFGCYNHPAAPLHGLVD